ncbi:hypothetical protein MRX96_028522 [Rhipicephalus microplus]
MRNHPLATVNLNNQAYRNDKRIEDAPRQPRDQVTTKNKGMEIAAAVAEQPKTTVREVEADLGLNHVSATTVKHRVYESGLRIRMAARKPLMRAENNAKQLQFVELNNTPTGLHLTACLNIIENICVNMKSTSFSCSLRGLSSDNL